MVTHNLPIQLAPFIGREEELAEIDRLLSDPACRLLTLVGPGGIGKTRLALQAAAHKLDAFTDGVYFVALQPLSAAAYLVPAIAEAIRYPFSGQESPQNQLLNYLRDKRLLLVMDNFEHLLNAAGFLVAILQGAPQVKILVTSREVLDLQEEWIRPVHGLRYPEDEQAEQLEAYSAVQLFDQRARRVQANFSLKSDLACAVRICRLVQGMPLAIELAAAWLKTMPCAEIAVEIEHSLDFLATTLRNVPERHRSMHALFEQSWQMLRPEEREVFKQLSVFQGGFTRQAAQAVAGADLHTLQALVDRSLLSVNPTGRYQIHELLRQFAAEKLAGRLPELERARRRHCAYYSGFLRRQEDRLKGPEQLAALAEMDADLDNLRLAWHWSIEQALDQQVRQSMGSLLIYYQMRTRIQEGTDAFFQAKTRFEKLDSALACELGIYLAWFKATGGDYQEAAGLYLAGLDLLQPDEIQDATAMALSGMTFLDDHGTTPWDLSTHRQVYQQLLAYYRQKGARWGMAFALYGLGSLAFHSKEYNSAREYLQAGLEHLRALGDRWASTWILNQLGILCIETKAYSEARQCFQETLNICQEVGDWGGIAFSLGVLGTIAALQHEYKSSWRYLINAIRVSYKWKREPFIAWYLVDLAQVLAAGGHKERAAEILAFLLIYATDPFTRNYVQKLFLQLEAELSPAGFTAAQRRGEAHDIDVMIKMLTLEFAGQEDVSSEAVTLHAAGSSGPDSTLVEPLSPREQEVLALVAAGHSNQEIARRLFITVGAVKKHLNNIFGKLQVRSRTQAVARAQALHLLPD